ncbi:MAG: AAA family ATPase [Planctomycetota bacterium]|nr:MAG: AAA family ATPase [Planctomycetota bacterium]REK22760.1 MAG: AAA family ATPase [Planctomycetota bacterium]REK33820.1 MAG: AAA family ATPase [Planctomycetota bacterium]
MPRENYADVLMDAGISPHDPERLEEFNALLRRTMENPHEAAAELMATRRNCENAAQAAEDLETMIRELVEKNATLVHVEAIRRTPAGEARAVCRMGQTLQELGILQGVDVEALERLQPWEFACVHDGVVIGMWNDDPALHASQLGDIVGFEGYADREQFQVRVTRPGHDTCVVRLAGSLRIEELTPDTRLILQRDDPRWAIASLPAEHSESKFEVSLDKVHARLEDLAGIDEVAEAYIQDILLRVVFEDVRDTFDLSPMRGSLLYSYQPGMGKTIFTEGLAVWLRDFGETHGFDVALYHVKPNQLKSMWWGEDARIVREELWGSIRARQAVPRERPLVQLLVFDEIDSLQKRGGGSNSAVSSASHSDALEALLVEMQGIASRGPQEGPPAHVLAIGLTNRPDRLDEALKRPGRFGDLIRPMPAITQDAAVEIMAIYAKKQTLPWSIDDESRTGVSLDEIRSRFLGPAAAQVFPLTVVQYTTDNQQTHDVTAGQILAGAHYEEAMNRAKKQAALRQVFGLGAPAICPEDVTESLLTAAADVARQMEADPGMLVQQLQIKLPVVRVTAVPAEELQHHHVLKLHTA